MISNSKMSNKNKELDFVWSSKKDYNSLYPLYKKFTNKGWDCNLVKVHRNKLLNFRIKKLSNFIVLAYSATYYRLVNSGWNGKFIYVDHGINPIKYYSYIYDFFYKSSLLFFPGEIFKEKMNKLSNNFNNGLLGGFPLSDDLINTKIDKNVLINDLKLVPNQPIILFTPTWGSKKKKEWGIHNNKYLKDYPNLITIPHPADYKYSKYKKNIVIPENRNHLNKLIHLADILISDVSSLILEASILNKTTIQLEMSNYPGCFPDIDTNDKNICIDKKILSNEIRHTNRSQKPFKISFLDEELIVDYTSTINNIHHTIEQAITNPDKNIDKRKYWVDRCCWKADGNTNDRIYRMINNFLINRTIEQLN